jgi:hypothetical protein
MSDKIVVQVIAAVVRDSSHRLFGCGINTDSQLGYQCPPTPKGQPLMCLLTPVPIRLPIDERDCVVRVSCGRSHTVCLTKSGERMTRLSIYLKFNENVIQFTVWATIRSDSAVDP